jgi:hypothetical protein
MQSVMTPGSATEGVGETEDRKSRMPKFGTMQVTLSLHRKVREQGTDHPRCVVSGPAGENYRSSELSPTPRNFCKRFNPL